MSPPLQWRGLRTTSWLLFLAQAAHCEASQSFVRSAAAKTLESIRVIERGWLSHRILNAILRHIAEDLYNVTVIFVPEKAYNGRQEIMQAIAAWDLDYDVESWLTDEQYRSFVLEDKTVLNPSGVGYDGQGGLFVPDVVLEDRMDAKFIEWYRSHKQDPSVVQLFPARKALNLSSPPSCHHFWCHDDNHWKPNHCKTGSSYCREIYHHDSAYDEATVESLVKSHRLNYTVVFLGSDFQSLIQGRIDRQEPTLLYHWAPHPLVDAWKLRRISFPSYRSGCALASTDQAGPSDDRLCDFPSRALQKLASRRFRQGHPMLYAALAHLTMDEESIIELMAAVTGNKSAAGVAGDWVRKHSAQIQSWIPQCSMSEFDATALECTEDVSFLRAENAARDLIRTTLGGSRLKVMTVVDEPFVHENSITTYHGFLPDLLRELKSQAGFDIEWVLPRPGTNRMYKSVFEQVVNGSADLVWAAHFNTWERSVQIKFTAPYMEGGMGMLSYKVPPTFMQKMYTPFEPFTPQVWGVFSCIGLSTAILTYFLDKWRMGMKEKDKEHAAKEERSAGRGPSPSTLPTFSTHLYYSIIGQAQPKTKGSRLILFAYMMLLTIFLAAYTANLAAFLSKTPSSDVLGSLSDVEEKRGSVCTLANSGIADLTRQRFVQLRQTPVPDQQAGMQKMMHSECLGFVYDMPILTWRASRDCNTYVAANSEFNKLNYVGGMSHSSPYQDLLPALNFFILKLRQEGFIDMLYEKHFRSSIKCDYNETQELGMQHMFGAVAAFMILIAAAVGGEAFGCLFTYFACFVAKNVTGMSGKEIAETISQAAATGLETGLNRTLRRRSSMPASGSFDGMTGTMSGSWRGGRNSWFSEDSGSGPTYRGRARSNRSMRSSMRSYESEYVGPIEINPRRQELFTDGRWLVYDLPENVEEQRGRLPSYEICVPLEGIPGGQEGDRHEASAQKDDDIMPISAGPPGAQEGATAEEPQASMSSLRACTGSVGQRRETPHCASCGLALPTPEGSERGGDREMLEAAAEVRRERRSQSVAAEPRRAEAPDGVRHLPTGVSEVDHRTSEDRQGRAISWPPAMDGMPAVAAHWSVEHDVQMQPDRRPQSASVAVDETSGVVHHRSLDHDLHLKSDRHGPEVASDADRPQGSGSPPSSSRRSNSPAQRKPTQLEDRDSARQRQADRSLRTLSRESQTSSSNRGMAPPWCAPRNAVPADRVPRIGGLDMGLDAPPVLTL
eukprot:TRINITY_DN20252_c0_g2_i2.p1 TRINITY_DN20252_c0_g2~~TRINITY_DN20252_c0_g2_i2.p1  ORF type:complete len:1235 (-),score=223.99 TRINITY_DN20252_c0_g2_i2:58-3762(-)